ncbi:putative porin [Saccharophagus sp. K07]|jgi:hypothetical protein|uniref:putative porin n=1 Tax=Saccharophagus sp. K07 TaxID=2283636 RepID=UPI001652AE85|nr:putative porin [Saccharophagus sp. K07]MBC6907046.1 putative porin [Saccharophagus sp. K07]
MNMKKLSAAILLALASTTVMADYQAEGTVTYLSADNDVDLFTLGGVYHFNTVSTDSHPLAEAAFLERSNNVSLTLGKKSMDAGDQDTAIAAVEIYIPEAMLYIAPFYRYDKYKPDGGVNSSENDWGVRIGLTPIEGFRVATTWSDEVDYELNFDVKYVLKLANDTALNLEFGFAEALEGGDDLVSAAVDYYFNRTFSVGLGIEDQYDTIYELRTRKFFTDSFSAFASYYNADDADAWKIGASLRF